ncbi:MAG: shikimate kinase [Vicinamibacteria bacterium]
MTLPERIALVGFMGSGKTTVGRLLAERIGYGFVDSDDAIEARAGMKVGEIFGRHGEAWFRRLEEVALRDLLKPARRVIATGGGAFIQTACAEEILDRAFTVHLSCDFQEAYRRASLQSGRPLAEKGELDVASLYAERKDKYSRAHATVDTTNRSPEEVVTDVLRLLSIP